MKNVTYFQWTKDAYVLEIHQDIKLQTPRSTVLLKKLTVHQIIKNFPACYRTERFVTMFTTN